MQWLRLWIGGIVVVLGFASSVAYGQGPPDLRRVQHVGHQLVLPCGATGQSCCRPQPAIAGDPTLAHCNTGLGCDIATNTCVSRCGGAGEVCCDGPGTRAPRWTADGRLYSPSGPFLQEMCRNATCDPTSRRCLIGCGHSEGQACCGPQPAMGVASCSGRGLYCEFAEGTSVRGICRSCGKAGGEACRNGCEGRFVPDANNICVPCGAIGQQSCSQAPSCADDAVQGPGGLCIQCGWGYRHQPVCPSGEPCRGFSIPDQTGKRCMQAALIGMSCLHGDCQEGVCERGTCFPRPLPQCGGLNERVCDRPNTQCRQGTPREGYCRAHDWNPNQPPNSSGRCCCKPDSNGMTMCGCWPSLSCP